VGHYTHLNLNFLGWKKYTLKKAIGKQMITTIQMTHTCNTYHNNNKLSVQLLKE